MTTKTIVRILDDAGSMLGWQEVWASIPGDGTLRSDAPVEIRIDAGGRPRFISIHWADMNVETRAPMEEMAEVHPGQVVKFPAGILMVVGNPPSEALPPVIERGHVKVGVPVGSMSAASM